MSRQRLTIVLSQAPGKHPAKRALEEALAAALLVEPGVEVSIVPHLYDLGPDHTGRLFLSSISGDVCVLSWLFPRAAYWLLDRDGIRGHLGETQLPSAAPAEDEDEEAPPAKGIGTAETLPPRHIYCLDLREFNKPEPYLTEIRRIVQECQTRREQARAAQPPVLVQLGMPTSPPPVFDAQTLLAPPGRRWYPVIDYSRCTNCMECLDFCLFGVYNVDKLDRILVENQDQCKKGCPACSRVCPEQAIMFPDYKTPAIAGAPVGAISGLKIDLTKLFGGDVQDALATAVAERDRELVADGRTAVGTSVGLAKRQTQPAGPKDDLDKLMDDLDALNW
jgi:hypothetical protein